MSHGRTRVPGFLFKPKGVGWRLGSIRFGSDRWLFGVVEEQWFQESETCFDTML
ncbi:hypothetical protein Hanom_Chr10g00879541 [Helianthus anomalus]